LVVIAHAAYLWAFIAAPQAFIPGRTDKFRGVQLRAVVAAEQRRHIP
jgi:hypothetical protein